VTVQGRHQTPQVDFIIFFGVLPFGEVVQTVKEALEAGFEKVEFKP
jgi:hypothetical protein